MLQRVSLSPARHERPPMRGRIAGAALLAGIYGATLYASVGLFQTPPTEADYAGCRLIGLLNVAVLPLLVLAAVVGVRKIWRAGAPSGHLRRLLMAPLWLSLMLSLLTVPIWMGQGNAARQGVDAAGLGVATTYLLAPWGFMLAYGLSLFITCAMFDFTFPMQSDANSQPNAAGLG